MRTRRSPAAQFAAVLAVTGIAVLAVNSAVAKPRAILESPAATDTLRPVSAFASIADPRARSAALFREMGKVIQHPRCVNCHPAGDRPLQTDSGWLHVPMVVRGAEGKGAPGMNCQTCHHAENFDPARVPGHPRWKLAPIEMAWQGKTLTEICEQIKDPARNGGKDMAKLVQHMGEDSLVGWGWVPGAGRKPVPGTQKEFGALAKAWADAGAHCPPG